MRTMKPKGKLKKNGARFGRMKLLTAETTSSESPDLSQLRKPIDVNLSSLKQVAQLFEKGSDEVQAILTYECDIIYECRICRSLFRSLANFISHKRVYCLEKQNVILCRRTIDRIESIYDKDSFARSEISIDPRYKENCTNDRILRSQSMRKEPKKDLTSVVDMLTKKQNNDSDCEVSTEERQNNAALHITSDSEQVLLELINSNQAAYQTVLRSENPAANGTDLMKSQANELKSMLNRNTAVLGPDGQLLEVNDIVRSDSQWGDEEDFATNIIPSYKGDLTCTICNAMFSTKKTLTFHFKSKHMPHRMCYLCPCCSSTFTNRWSVYRHLFKVHRKSNDQVRRLRAQIQDKAFRKDLLSLEKAVQSGSETSKSREASEERVLDETPNLTIAQEWMENLELDAELQRCGACGKRFERKAALLSHSQICQNRSIGTRQDRTGRQKRASKNPPQRIIEVTETENNETCGNDVAPMIDTISENTAALTNIATDDWKIPAQKSLLISKSRSSSVNRKSQASTVNEKCQSIVNRQSLLKSRNRKTPSTSVNSKIVSSSVNSQVVSSSINSQAELSSVNTKIVETSVNSKIARSSVIPSVPMEISIRVKDVSSLSKDVWDKIGTSDDGADCDSTLHDSDRSPLSSPQSRSPTNETNKDESSIREITEVPEVIYTSIDNSRPVALSILGKEKKLGIQYRGIRLPTVTLEKINVPRSRVSTENPEPNVSLNVSKERLIQSDKIRQPTQFRKLQCLPCNRRFMSMANLRRHIAVHMKRNRYRCKICDFKSFLKCDIVAHCNKKHNAKNNRTLLADMVIEVPINNDPCENEKTTMNNMITETRDELEIIKVNRQLPKIDKVVESSDDNKVRIDKMTKNINSLPIEQAKITVVSTVPRRGRPPNSKKKGRRGKTKNKIRPKARITRHVSPPRLPDDSSDEMSVIGKSFDDEKSAKFSCIRAPSRLDCDPELRKMVMEVIFGSTDCKETKANSNELQNESMTNINDDCEMVLDCRETLELSPPRDTQVVTDQSTKFVTTEELESVRSEPDIADRPNEGSFSQDYRKYSNEFKAITINGDNVVSPESLNYVDIRVATASPVVNLENRVIIQEDNVVHHDVTEAQQTNIILCAEK